MKCILKAVLARCKQSILLTVAIFNCRVKFGVPLANTLVDGQLPEALVVRNV